MIIKVVLFIGLITTLLLGENTKPTVKVLAKSTKSWTGDLLPHYGTNQPEITILKITIPPKYQLPLHKHPVINAGVLIKGSLTVISSRGERLNLKEGEGIVEMVERWHYGINESNEEAEIIVFYAGEVGTPITVKRSQ